MGQTDKRALRALLGTGTLLTTTFLAAGSVAAQTPGPDAAPAAPPVEGAAVPTAVAAKADTSLVVTKVRHHVLAGQRVVVRGVLRPAGAGNVVRLQVRADGRWQTVDRDRTGAAGRYVLAWRPSGTGSRRVRVRFKGTDTLQPSRRTAGRANVYRRALASWYGPGLYGGHLACGGTLSSATLGVAHKSLPCGTEVTLRYRGTSVRVPVVDRGPYVGAREFDLTSATKTRLGFGGTGTVLTTR